MPKAPKVHPKLAYEKFLQDAKPMVSLHWMAKPYRLKYGDSLENDLIDLMATEKSHQYSQELRRLRGVLKGDADKQGRETGAEYARQLRSVQAAGKEDIRARITLLDAMMESKAVTDLLDKFGED